MRSESVNYETLADVTYLATASRDVDDVIEHSVHELTKLLGLKGCAIMLLDRKTQELEVVSAHGLSDEYLNKGPVSALKSISRSISEGPVAIFDVDDDPRLQYPEEAVREGISSILSMPLMLGGRPLGVLRFYTAEPWEFSERDLLFGQAVAAIISLTVENLRVCKGLKSSIEVLKLMRQAKRPMRRTLYE